jgi:hypothetical protein
MRSHSQLAAARRAGQRLCLCALVAVRFARKRVGEEICGSVALGPPVVGVSGSSFLRLISELRRARL